jgi:hypothetical protein
MARRVLFTRGGAAVKGDVDRWLAALDRQDVDFERLRLEGLRLEQGLDRGRAGDVDLVLLRAVLASPDSRSRAAACRVVCDWADRIEAPVELLAPAVDDPAPQVRLEAVRALAALGGTRAAELARYTQPASYCMGVGRKVQVSVTQLTAESEKKAEEAIRGLGEVVNLSKNLDTGIINELLLPQFAAGVLPNGLTVHGFGEDSFGEIYAMVTNTPANGTGGIIYKFESNIPAPGALGLLGCVAMASRRRRAR